MNNFTVLNEVNRVVQEALEQKDKRISKLEQGNAELTRLANELLVEVYSYSSRCSAATSTARGKLSVLQLQEQEDE